MAILREAKREKPGTRRRVWITVGVIGALVVLALLPMYKTIWLGGYALQARHENAAPPPHTPLGFAGKREQGAIVVNVWVGSSCCRWILLSPNGNSKMLI